MEAEDWLESIEKKLEIAQCSDKEKMLFAAHQLFGTATLTRMSVLSPGTSSKLDLELTTYLVVRSN
jgi:hypothetical protein